MSELMPTGKAAPHVGVSTSTLTRMVKAGEITPALTTAGGHYRWNLSSLQAQMQRFRTGEPNITAREIARVVHAAQRELQIIQGDPVPSPPWDDAPVYQVEQSIAGVQEVLHNPQLTPEESQRLWQDRMRADGWTYGQEKDHARKTHPNLVPWDALPTEQKLKDQLFIAIIRALAPTMQRS